MSEDNYPSIEIKCSGQVYQDKSNWYWLIKTEIEGPDEGKSRRSGKRTSKQSATENMIDMFTSVVADQVAELMS